MTLKKLFSKEAIEKMQMERGYCYLWPRHYATISAKRTCCSTGVESDEQVPYIIERAPGSEDLVFRLLKGSTGWEAFYAKDLLARSCADWWAACFGTPGRWDRLMINGAEVLEILRGCGHECN
ncbi:hypothetical protein SPB21_03630 [Leptothoe sp. ISB3NOV94-8A]